MIKLAHSWKKILLGLLLAVAFFLRFYNLPNTLQFQGDQGRDAIIVADIFREKDLVFIGPVTSVGNMYLGPLYYYFMLPFLWLTYPSPMGPVYAVAALGGLTVFLVYWLGKKMFGEKTALIVAFFYTFSAVFIQNSRFSWNPNPAPFVSALLVYLTFLAWKKNPKYWIGVVAAFSVLIQLHYLTLLTLPAMVAVWLADAYSRTKKSQQSWSSKTSLAKKARGWWSSMKPLVIPSLIGATVFLASLTPLVLFDLKHEGANLQAFQKMLSDDKSFKYTGNESLSSQALKTLRENEGRGMHILFEVMIGKNRVLNKTLLYITIIVLTGSMLTKHRQKKDAKQEWVLISFLGFGILGTALYEHSIFDHYIAYLFPITAWVYGYVLAKIRPRLIGNIALIGLAAFFLQYNLPRLPLKNTGWTVNDIQRTSQIILEKINPGEKYNIILLSENRDIEGQNYRYFLTTGHTPPVATEDRGDTDTLFIINEEKKIDRVVDSPIYEIVVFPNKEPAEVFTIENDGPIITVLRRTTQQPLEPIE